MTSLKMIIMIARDWRDWWPISGVGSWSAFSLISPLINLQVLSLVIEYDVNGNGKLDFDEFMEMMRKQVQWIQQMRKKRGYQKYNIERPRFNFQAEHQDNSAELREAFKIFDRLDSLMFLRNGKVKWFSPQGWKRVHWCCRIEKGTRLNLLLCAKNTYNLSMFPLHPSKKILFVQSALFGDVLARPHFEIMWGCAFVQLKGFLMMNTAEKICLLEKQRSQGTPVSFQERQHCVANGKGEEEKELVCSIKKKNIVSLLQMLQLQCLTKYS